MANKLRTATAVGVLIPALLAALETPVSAQSPSFDLTAPTAGQVFQVGQTCTITWTSTETSDQVYLYLYKAADSVINLGHVPAGQGRFDWQIPLPVCDGDDYRVLGEVFAEGEYLERWGPAFTIQGGGPAPHLMAPNGGEVLEAGSTYSIQWTEPINIDPCAWFNTIIRLYKGQQYRTIIGWLPPEGGGFDWTLCPTLEPGDDYTLQLEIQACDVTFTDWCDQPFSIHSNLHPSLTIVSPNGDETLTAGQRLTVRWSAVDLGDQPITVAFGRPHGALYTLGTAPASAGELTVALCSSLDDAWDYTIGVLAGGCQPQLSDSNDAPFHVFNPSPPPPLKLIHPAGGETFEAGAQCLVEWAGPTHDFFDLTSWAMLSLLKAGQEYDSLPYGILTPNQIVTNLCTAEEGDDYSLRLTIHDCGGNHEAETAPFSITHVKHPALTLLSPSAGGTFRAGEPLAVRWTGTELGDRVSVDLLKAGQHFQSLGAAPAAVGQLTVVLCPGASEGSDYTIVISSSDGCVSASDSSDLPITITGGWLEPSLTITSPAAGDVWVSGTQQQIAWTGTNPHGNVSAELWRGHSELDYLSVPAQSDGRFLWDVCAWEPGDDYTILLRVYECETWHAFRSEPFTILGAQDPPPTLTVTSPNGGEVIHGGSRQVITWTSTNPRGPVWIRLMRGENDWDDLGEAPMSAGRFDWDVCTFGQERNDYTIRLTQSQCPWYTDDSSDAPFTVDEVAPWPHVTVVSPSFGDVVQAGSTATITWTAENPSGNVLIYVWEYGFPWHSMPIGEVPMAAGSFTWQVCPFLPSGSHYNIHLAMSPCNGYWNIADGYDFTITGSGSPAADLDFDCDVDADDLRLLDACLTGPGVLYNLDNRPPGCPYYNEGDAYLPADIDHDGDVDQDDFGLLQRSFTATPAS